MDSPTTSLPGQLLLKHPELLAGQSILIANCPDQEVLAKCAAQNLHSQMLAWYFDFSQYKQAGLMADSQKWQSSAGNWLAGKNSYDLIVLFLPKGDRFIEYCLTMANQLLKSNGSLLLVGANNAGIKSAGKDLEKYIGNIVFKDAARHSVIYKTESKNIKLHRSTWEDFIINLEYRDEESLIKIKSLPGVFSHDHIDEGTKFLLDNVRLADRGQLLDIGCGNGIIGAVMQQRYPDKEIWLADNNAVAVTAAEQTMKANKFSQAIVQLSDVYSEINGQFDEIIANPPFHNGIPTDYSISEKIFRNSAFHLKENGRMYVVANSFLNYKQKLEKYIGPVRVIAQNNRYKIYEALYHGTKI